MNLLIYESNAWKLKLNIPGGGVYNQEFEGYSAVAPETNDGYELVNASEQTIK